MNNYFKIRSYFLVFEVNLMVYRGNPCPYYIK